ncbi:putative SH3 domain protein [Mycena venus]|uniref:Putative SH3 domain protein n=1 Tax=Mycena venus TaxID=2733690 RepID=A0A8H7CRR7_9AGAR|nr:putative SH3 domain protein [Mycena venus]
MKVLHLSALFLPFVLGSSDFTVGVGKDENTGKKGLGFDPSSIVPAIGDFIVFEFRSGSHSAVQSTFENPCTPKDGGFNSGVQTVDDSLAVDAPGLPTVRLLVNDTQPIWFFDQAGGLCNKGAVLSVNPSATQTDAAFKANAANAVESNTTSSAPSSGPSGSASGSPSDSASRSASATGPDASQTGKPSGAERLIAGGAYGVVLLAVLCALV